MATQPWTPEEDAALFRMWMTDGVSAGLCAKAFPGRSRNSIIGRAFRMGWKRQEPSDPAKRLAYPGARASAIGSGNPPGSRAALKIGQRKTAEPRALDVKAADVLSPNAAPWIQRRARQCAYPVSGQGADTVACCNATEAVYCQAHEAVMYVGAPAVKWGLGGKPKAQPKERFFAEWAA